MIRELIVLASSGANGRMQEVSIKEWDRIFVLAQEHNVVPLVAAAIMSMPKDECTAPIFQCFLEVLRNTGSKNLIRKQRILRLLTEMKENGIMPIILKGDTVARYYAYPESRGAVDTDILISEEQEQVAYDFFEEKGFEVIRRSKTSHHGICQHKKYGKIELHTKLYDDIVSDVWFRGIKDEELVCEEFDSIQAEDGSYFALGPTDQLLFLTLHMVKHFIDGGLTLGMMIDLMLCYENNFNRIDSVRYWRVLADLHYSKLINAVYGIMVKYGGFNHRLDSYLKECSDDQMNMILLDLEQGGYMGRCELQERYEAGMEYNRYRILQTRNKFQYMFYMMKWKIRSASKNMFLPYKELKINYPFVEKYVVMMPFIWMYQMCAYPIAKITKGVLKRDIRVGGKGLSEVAQKRIEMFKCFDMI